MEYLTNLDHKIGNLMLGNIPNADLNRETVIALYLIARALEVRNNIENSKDKPSLGRRPENDDY